MVINRKQTIAKIQWIQICYFSWTIFKIQWVTSFHVTYFVIHFGFNKCYNIPYSCMFTIFFLSYLLLHVAFLPCICVGHHFISCFIQKCFVREHCSACVATVPSLQFGLNFSDFSESYSSSYQWIIFCPLSRVFILCFRPFFLVYFWFLLMSNSILFF